LEERIDYGRLSRLLSNNPTPPPLTDPLSLHDALPISPRSSTRQVPGRGPVRQGSTRPVPANRQQTPHVRAEGSRNGAADASRTRSEEHTSELQSRENLVCRLLLEKKNTQTRRTATTPR